MSTPKGDAEVMLEILEHPERFCQICYKRVGVCRHTKGKEVRGRAMNRCKYCGRFTNATERDLCESCKEKEEDRYYEEIADREICVECGVPHGPNPYTGYKQ